MRLKDYLELVDCTGRVLRTDKRGAIGANSKKILSRLDIDEDQWLEMAVSFEDCFSYFAGGKIVCEWLVSIFNISVCQVW
jgi:hypothetical protein